MGVEGFTVVENEVKKDEELGAETWPVGVNEIALLVSCRVLSAYAESAVCVSDRDKKPPTRRIVVRRTLDAAEGLLGSAKGVEGRSGVV